jgi:hypothetical protein
MTYLTISKFEIFRSFPWIIWVMLEIRNTLICFLESHGRVLIQSSLLSQKTACEWQPPVYSTLEKAGEMSPRVLKHAPSRGLNPGLPSLRREQKHWPALVRLLVAVHTAYQRVVRPCAVCTRCHRHCIRMAFYELQRLWWNCENIVGLSRHAIHDRKYHCVISTC